jgi:hypothetical protein
MSDDDRTPDRRPIPPTLRACGLWERHSAKGTYLAGRWGDLRVMVIRVENAGPDAPTHRLVLTEAVQTREDM